ncbi:restriction endonuclease subunit S [Acetobacterium carbinolicum]|uniref:restriction endonuclease subunit S n=1 Tax=Acetobacterium carbinolicum TaxID=52690 RepID=UPI0039BF23DA
MSDKKVRVPQIRFAGFTGDWEERKVGELSNVASASRVHKEEWTTTGVPFFRSSDVVSAYKGNENQKAFISFKLYEQLVSNSGRLEKDDILITGGGSIGIPYIVPNDEPLYSKDADLIWIKSSDKFNSRYLYTYFTTPGFRKYLSAISHIGTISHYTIEQVKGTPICLPSVDEQDEIGLYFTQLDNLITLQQRQLDKLAIVKKTMLEKMFPKDGANVPEIRFAGFTGAWEQRKVDNVVDVRSGRDYKHLSSGVIPVYGTGGYMLSVNEALSYDEDAIGIGRKGTIDKPYILRAPFWTVDTLFYTVPREEYDLNFVFDIFQNIDWKKKDESTGVPSLSKTVINSIVVRIPGYREQKTIGNYFAQLDNLITLHQRQLNTLKTLKQSLLQQLFI